ncbi:unnamed protein product [Closterium sp. NIES-64]|nr:unnamed protein product [Closterium sp. NIES-64]
MAVGNWIENWWLEGAVGGRKGLWAAGRCCGQLEGDVAGQERGCGRLEGAVGGWKGLWAAGRGSGQLGRCCRRLGRGCGRLGGDVGSYALSRVLLQQCVLLRVLLLWRTRLCGLGLLMGGVLCREGAGSAYEYCECCLRVARWRDGARAAYRWCTRCLRLREGEVRVGGGGEEGGGRGGEEVGWVGVGGAGFYIRRLHQILSPM